MSGMPDQPEEKRGSSGPRSIAETTARLTKRSLGKRGFTEAALVSEWSLIVGSLLGAASLPLRINFPRGERTRGTLQIRVSSGAMATQIQHQEPLLIQRINGYFGYGAVSRLTISQGPIPRAPQTPAPAGTSIDRGNRSKRWPIDCGRSPTPISGPFCPPSDATLREDAEAL